MKKTHTVTQILFLIVSLLTGRVFAHDFWLEAQPFYTESGKTVDLSVHVGNDFAGESLPNIVNWYTDFSLYQATSKTKVKGELGRDPAGFFIPEQNGTYAIGYQSTFSYVEIDSDTFNRYLKEEGLDNAIDYRQKYNQTQAEGKENYIRHAKVLVQAGNEFDIDNSALKFGYELEIIPVENPYLKKINDNLDVQILYKNKPIDNILLIAFTKTNPQQTQRVRSDQNGKATITLNQTGPWLLKAVKILKLEENKADWQSHWASLTFAVRKK